MAAGTLLTKYLSRFGCSTDGLSVETVAFAAALDAAARVDPSVADAVLRELNDERSHLKLIASENFASPAVLLAMGNWLSDKYAEGSPGHRLYAGCDNVDTIEARVDELACALFGAEHAYAQPHSGIDANLVAFWAVLSQRVESPALERLGVGHVNDLSAAEWETLRQELGNQTLLGMSLEAGGHLTHGFRPNISGKLFRHRSYGVDPETFLLDYDEVRRSAREERPLILLAGYSSYPRLINFRVMREIADEVDATFMVDMAHFAGLVAGRVLTGDYDPVPHAHVVTTTTHKTLRDRAVGSRSVTVTLPSSSTAAARWCSGAHCRTSWPPRPSRWPKRPRLPSRSMRLRSWTTPGCSPKRSWLVACPWSPAGPTTTWCSSMFAPSG